MDIIFGYVYNFCMMVLMVKEAHLNRIDVPEDYEVLDASALGRRLGFKRGTVLAYLSRRNFRRIPRPNRQLSYCGRQPSSSLIFLLEAPRSLSNHSTRALPAMRRATNAGTRSGCFAPTASA